MPQKEAASSMKRPKENLCNSTEVWNPFLSFYFSRRNRLRRKLKHRCFLTLPQISQQGHLPIGKFQRIMMRSRVVTVNLPKDGCRVFDHRRPPAEQPAACTAPYRSGEVKLCSRKNANRHIGIFRRSKSDCTGIEVLRSQLFTDLSRT